jgi:hypothetical protein
VISALGCMPMMRSISRPPLSVSSVGMHCGIRRPELASVYTRGALRNDGAFGPATLYRLSTDDASLQENLALVGILKERNVDHGILPALPRV